MHAPRCSQGTRQNRAPDASPGLAYTLGLMPYEFGQPSSETCASLKAGSACALPGSDGRPEEQPTQSCFHFASRFHRTLRLAHMLYSLARVSRRDRWGWIVHHSVYKPRRSSRGNARQTAWYDQHLRREASRAKEQTRKQLVARGSYQNLHGYDARLVNLFARPQR